MSGLTPRSNSVCVIIGKSELCKLPRASEVTLLKLWFAFGHSFELPGFNFGGVENLGEIKPNPVADPMKGKPSLGTPAADGAR